MKTIFLLSLTFTLAACGPSAYEKGKQLGWADGMEAAQEGKPMDQAGAVIRSKSIDDSHKFQAGYLRGFQEGHKRFNR